MKILIMMLVFGAAVAENYWPNDDPFKVVWNGPSARCGRKYHVDLDLAKYDIIANQDQKFLGKFMTIFYNLGKFPKIDRYGNILYNGVPDLGNVTEHLEASKKDITDVIPDPSFKGLAVIDQEWWLSSWELMHSSYSEYWDLSLDAVRKDHPEWSVEAIAEVLREQNPKWSEKRVAREAKRQSKALIKNEAIKRFDVGARKYMEGSLNVAKELRPGGNWGYYHYPYCYNGKPGRIRCPPAVREKNDRILWMYEASQALYPSVYLYSSAKKAAARYIYGNLEETFRLGNKFTPPKPVWMYSTFRYHSKEFYSKEDLLTSLNLAAGFGSHGVVLWSSSSDYKKKTQCENLKTYLDETLGPFVEKVIDDTRKCSKKICSGNGRCQRRDIKDLMTVPDSEFPEKFEAVREKTASWTGESKNYDEFVCRCYQGWKGKDCSEKVFCNCDGSSRVLVIN